MTAAAQPLDLSIVSPAHDEEENLPGLVSDVRGVLENLGLTYELIVVNDGSNDRTVEVGRSLMGDAKNCLRVVSLETPAGRSLGPSAGYCLGIRLARGRLIAIMDADRQNDPADIPAMIKLLEEQNADMVQGDRSANRRDNLVRRVSSLVGRGFRNMVLGDQMRDSACAMRLLKAELAREIPFEFKGLHRFTAFYAGMIGYRVVQMPVNHRPRTAGRAKFGVWNRALPGLPDLLAVCWMRNRWRRITLKSEPSPQAQEEQSTHDPEPATVRVEPGSQS